MQTFLPVKSFVLRIFDSQHFRNSSWSIADSLAIPIMLLLATPFFITSLGAEQYGFWMLVNSIIATLGIGAAGLAATTIKYISQYRSTNDKEKIRQIICSTFFLYLTAGSVIIALGLWLSASDALSALFGIEVTDQDLLQSSLLFATITFGFKLVEQFLLSIYKGFERYDYASFISLLSKIFMLGSNVVVVLYGYGLVEIFIWSAIVSFAMLVAEFILLKKFAPYLTLLPSINRQRMQELGSYFSWSWYQSALNILVQNIDKFLVAALAGPVILAYYSIALLVGNFAIQILSSASSWLLPVVSRKSASEAETTPLYYNMQFLIILTGLVLLSFLFFFKEHVFLTWLGEETYANSIEYILLFLCFSAVSISSIAPFYFLNGAGLVKLSAGFQTLSSLLTMALMYLGFQYGDVLGLIWGRIIALVIGGSITRTVLHFKMFNENNPFIGFYLTLPSLAFILLISNNLYINEQIPTLVIVLLLGLSIYFVYFKKSGFAV